MKRLCVVLVNCANYREAKKIAEVLVDRRIAACVNIIPRIHSIYRWQGRLMRSTEATLLIKTRRELFGVLKKEVCRRHSYECPEIIALGVTASFDAYQKWVNEETLSP